MTSRQTLKRVGFQAGKSGNKAGRPSNVLSKKEWMDKNIDDTQRRLILDKAIDLAIEGKPSMIELILTRVLPPLASDDSVEINLRNMTHKQRAEAIFDALTEKRVTPTQAHLLFATLSNNAKVVELTEVIERIEKLEKLQQETR